MKIKIPYLTRLLEIKEEQLKFEKTKVILLSGIFLSNKPTKKLKDQIEKDVLEEL